MEMREIIALLAVVIAFISALCMPFLLFILSGIRGDLQAIWAALNEHIRDDAAVASRVSVLESRLDNGAE